MYAQKQSGHFPHDFLGTWKGKLHWIKAGKPVQEFTMRLSVYALDSINLYAWRIEYGDSSNDSRPYVLKPVNIEKQHWAIDENNGIILDNYVAGHCLQGAFTVMGNTIVNNYCLENGRLRVEFFTIKLADKSTSGKGTEESPIVNSYGMGGYQYGWLDKVD